MAADGKIRPTHGFQIDVSAEKTPDNKRRRFRFYRFAEQPDGMHLLLETWHKGPDQPPTVTNLNLSNFGAEMLWHGLDSALREMDDWPMAPAIPCPDCDGTGLGPLAGEFPEANDKCLTCGGSGEKP